MGLIDNVLKALRREPTEIDSEYTASTVRTSDEVHHTYTSSNPRDYTRVGRALAGSVYNAATLIAREAAKGELKLYRKKTGVRGSKSLTRAQVDFLRGRSAIKPQAKAVSYANNAEDIEQVTEHEVLMLLNDPDPSTTYCDLMTMLYWYREVAGKAYIWTGGPKPVGLFLLHPQYTKPIVRKDGGLVQFLYGRDNLSPMTVPMEEVIISRFMPDPFAPWDGISWVQSIEQYADMENAAVVSEVARWRNSGQYGMILKAPANYNDTQLKQLESSLRGKGGPLAAGRALIVRDLEVVEAGNKPNEMHYVEGIEQAERAIYRAAGVPEAIWKLNDANLASAAAADPIWQRNIYERQSRVAQDLTEWLLPMFGIEPGTMWFAYDNPSQDDVELQTNRMATGYVNGAIYTNEYRQALGLNPLPDDANTLGKPMPMSMPPIALTATPEAEDSTQDATEDAEELKVSEAAAKYLDAFERVRAQRSIDSGAASTGGVIGDGAVDASSKAATRKPPEAARAEAERGLAWREEFGRGGTAVGVARARDIANGANLSDETIMRMVSYFARHEVDKQGTGWSKGDDGYPSAGRIAWALWGGDAGRTWAESEAAKIDAEEEKMCKPKGEGGQTQEHGEWATEPSVEEAEHGKMCGPESKIIEDEKMKTPGELTDAELALLADRLRPFLSGSKAEAEEPMPEAEVSAEVDPAAVAEIVDQVIAEITADPSKVEVSIEPPEEEMPEGEMPEAEGEMPIEIDRYDTSAVCSCGKCFESKAATPEDDERLTPSQRMEREMRKLIEAWAIQALGEAIRSIKPDGTFDESAFDPASLEKVTREVMQEAFKRGAMDQLSKTGSDLPPLSSNPAREYIAKYNFELVQGVTRTMRNQLRTAIDAELAKGEAGVGTSINQIQQNIADKVNEMPMNRAEVVARTETARAYAHGSMKQAEELGFTKKYWSEGGNPCGLCQAASRTFSKDKSIPIGKAYYLPGEAIVGTDGKTYMVKMPIMAPSDIHPNCTCVNIEEIA